MIKLSNLVFQPKYLKRYNNSYSLTLSTLGKTFSRRYFEIFFLIFLGNGIWHSMQMVSYGNYLHEMSNPVSWANKKNIINLSSAEFAQKVVKVNTYQFPFLFPKHGISWKPNNTFFLMAISTLIWWPEIGCRMSRSREPVSVPGIWITSGFRVTLPNRNTLFGLVPSNKHKKKKKKKKKKKWREIWWI